MSDSCSISDDSPEIDSDGESGGQSEYVTPTKRSYKRTIQHGFNQRRAKYFKLDQKDRSENVNLQITDNESETESEISCKESESNSQITDNETEISSDSDSNKSVLSSLLTASHTSDTDTDFMSDDHSIQFESSDEDNSIPKKNWGTPTFSPIYEGCKHTHESSYIMILLFVLKHGLTNAAFSDLLLLISSHLPVDAKFSTTVYKLKESLKAVLVPHETVMHFYCDFCQNYSSNDNQCENPVCRRNGASMITFHDLNFEQQLKNMFKDDTFFNLIQLRSKRTSVEGRLYDICDGQVYKDTKAHLQHGADVYLTITMNTDGVSLFTSSNKGSMWPVYFAINELPVKLRFSRKYLIPCLLHCQSEKPNMLTYLKPAMDILNRLHSTGIEVVTSTGKLRVKVHLIAGSFDLPARALVSNMKQYNGKNPCTFCLDEGTCPPGNTLTRYFPFKEELCIRSHTSVLRDAETASRTGVPTNGIKGASQLMALPYLKQDRVFVIDWMHGVLLGVTKKLLYYWLDSSNRNKVFYIGNKINLLNQRLLSIKPPDFVSRAQRKLEEHSHWKASECREWLIHFSPGVLQGVLHSQPYFHYLLLVTAMALLTKFGVTYEELDSAEQLLTTFCEAFPRIYGVSQQTMNVHLLRHVVSCCRQYGPLYSYSCFGFESMNSYIKKMVHGTRHVNSQICFAVGMTRKMGDFIKKWTDENNEPDSMLRRLAKQLGSNFTLEDKSGTEERVLGATKPMVDTHQHYGMLPAEMQNQSPLTFCRLQKGDTVYHCKEYQNAKTKNCYTVSFLDEQNEEKYGFIVCFVVVNHLKYAVINVCSTDKFVLDNTEIDRITEEALLNCVNKNLCPHQKKVVALQQSVIVTVDKLLKKCVYMEFNQNLKFISVPPNTLEHG